MECNNDRAQWGVYNVERCFNECDAYKAGVCLGVECDNYAPEDDAEAFWEEVTE